MSYALVAMFLATGDAYVEQRGLSITECAGRAAMVRQEMMPVMPLLQGLIGEVRYLCIPENRA